MGVDSLPVLEDLQTDAYCSTLGIDIVTSNNRFPWPLPEKVVEKHKHLEHHYAAIDVLGSCFQHDGVHLLHLVPFCPAFGYDVASRLQRRTFLVFLDEVSNPIFCFGCYLRKYLAYATEERSFHSITTNPRGADMLKFVLDAFYLTY